MLSTIRAVLAESSDGGGAAVAIVLFAVAVAIIQIVAYWKIFTKSGEAGWKCLIPIYNVYVLLKIVGRPGWWLLLYFVPFVNVVILIIVLLDLAKSFGKGAGFGIGLIFLPFIFSLILGFGDARYVGPAAAQTGAGYPPPPPPPPA